jgi:hypothetical protein
LALWDGLNRDPPTVMSITFLIGGDWTVQSVTTGDNAPCVPPDARFRLAAQSEVLIQDQRASD